MPQTASAIYENGVLRPTSLLSDLREGQQVQITVQVLEELTARGDGPAAGGIAPPHGSRRRLGPLPASVRTSSRRLATVDY